VQATTADESTLTRILVDELETFEADLSHMFKVGCVRAVYVNVQIYLHYVLKWGEMQAHKTLMRSSGEWTQSVMKRFENEWKFAKRIAISVLSGESYAAKCFWCVLLGQCHQIMAAVIWAI
jgi:hypothetical protein